METSPTPYTTRSWFYRRQSFLLRRWRISRDPEGCGVFTTDQALPGTPAWAEWEHGLHGPLGHAHLSFLSHTYGERGWWYGATVLTVEQAALELLEEKVETNFQAFLSQQGVSWDKAMGRSIHGDGALAAPEPFAALAGVEGKPRTGWECYQEEWGRIAPSNWKALPLKVGVKRDLSLPRYVGLSAVVDREGLDRDFLVDFVKSFWDSGEVESGRPIDWDMHGPRLEDAINGQVEFYARLGGRQG